MGIEKTAFVKELLGLGARKTRKLLKNLDSERKQLVESGTKKLKEGRELEAKAEKNIWLNPFKKGRRIEGRRLKSHGAKDVNRANNLSSSEKKLKSTLEKEEAATTKARTIAGAAVAVPTAGYGIHKANEAYQDNKRKRSFRRAAMVGMASKLNGQGIGNMPQQAQGI